MIKQLKLNNASGEQWDIVQESGQLVLTSGDDYIAQKAKQILLLVKGEWFADTEAGIPYFQDILVANPDIPLIESIIVNAIRNDEVMIELGVTDTVITSTTFDKINRSLTMDIDIIVGDETITLEGFSL